MSLREEIKEEIIKPIFKMCLLDESYIHSVVKDDNIDDLVNTNTDQILSKIGKRIESKKIYISFSHPCRHFNLDYVHIRNQVLQEIKEMLK